VIAKTEDTYHSADLKPPLQQKLVNFESGLKNISFTKASTKNEREKL
jgi:hypothetical protein